tara:strand:- start:237 stop:473 length:237 start_codon:yes stop_codon:yes gene_type:complete
MAFETKIKEVKSELEFPALYSTSNRSSIILALRGFDNKIEGVVMHPKQSFGEYSMTWSKDKYKRMNKGSELSFKFTQE